MRAFLCIAILPFVLSVYGYAFTTEVGALWHDGQFAPFARISDGLSAIGIMRNGTGCGDGRVIYLIWWEWRYWNARILLGGRINIRVEESLTTTYELSVVGLDEWPFAGAAMDWHGKEVFAETGAIWTWHGEGWALWPLYAIGIYNP